MLEAIKEFSNVFLERTKDKEIIIISHFDTDGITSASIFSKCLRKLDINFSIKIVKNLENETIQELPDNKVIVFLDLGSASLEEISKIPNQVFILDHHELDKEKIPTNVKIINPHLFGTEEMSSSCVTYLVAKQLTNEKESANLAVIGLVGDMLDKHIGKITNTIIADAETVLKKGILLYPSTRPLDKTLEYSSNPFIPGVTGDPKGAKQLLREIGIEATQKGYKALIELNEDEMKNLVTAVVLKMPNKDDIDFIGNILLVKFFNKLEDTRELSALINACSRMGFSDTALLLCMGNKKAKETAEKIYVKYKRHIVDALKYVNSEQHQKIEGKQYVIINAKENIKDTIIGTIASILSNSAVYEEGKIIIAMAYNQDKIKVSARISGRKPNNKNLKEIMDSLVQHTGGLAGGHKFAAGCLIEKNQEDIFIEFAKKKLDVEMIKI